MFVIEENQLKLMKGKPAISLIELVKGPRVASASWPAYGDVQPFTGAAKLNGFLVFVIKYVRRLISK